MMADSVCGQFRRRRVESVNETGANSASAHCVCAVGNTLGEGPLWVERENAVYWVDIKGAALHRLSLADRRHRSWAMPEYLCWVVERETETGFIAGFRNRIAVLQLDPVRIEELSVPEPLQPENRLNDAAVDSRGRIWFGTMDDGERRASGALYRLDPDGRTVLCDEGYVISNGPAVSPGGEWLYHTDSGRRTIYRFSLAGDGTLGPRESFVEFPHAWGAPDGMATDETGAIWVAHWGGGRVSRFLPDGTLDRAITVPAGQATSCCFAGRNLDRMFITSAAIGAQSEPDAGNLFEAAPGVRGAPTGRYLG